MAVYRGAYGARGDELAAENLEFVWRYYTRLALLLSARYRRRLQHAVLAHGSARLSRARRLGGGGAVIVSCHLGEMEVAGSWLAERRGCEVVAVVDEVTPRCRQLFFDSVRRACGIQLRRQGSTSLDELCGDLAAGRIVLLMLDRRCPSSIVEGSFMGRRASFSSAPWLLSTQAQVPVLAATTARAADGGCEIRFGALTTPEESSALGPERLIRRLVADLELAIGAAPAQWHVPADLNQLPFGGHPKMEPEAALRPRYGPFHGSRHLRLLEHDRAGA